MDWVNQNKLRNLLIIVLLGLNILTVSVIWMQAARRPDSSPADQVPRTPESANLLTKMLDLDKGQAVRVGSILTDQHEQSRNYNDRLAELKRQLAEELFKQNPDTTFAESTAKEIGGLQTKVEMIRFYHFQQLLELCTPDQRAKLKPVVIEVFGRRPPREEPGQVKPRQGEAEPQPLPENNPKRATEEKPAPLRDDRTGPPSIEEKLAKYSERLNLSDEQKDKIRAILLKSKEKGDQLRERIRPEEGEIQATKERIRQDEDAGIMNILNKDQKPEFAKMISKRRP